MEAKMAKLLVVDDDVGSLAWMVPALESRGHVVRGFESASAALAALEAWRPDLIIADILMPEMDGLTFARLVRRHRGVPLMFLSIAKKEAEAVIAEAVGYVRKPTTADEIRAAVDRVLGRRSERNTIFVVDDDPAIRELYPAFLEPRFTVATAEHGVAALEVLSAQRVDLAIIDIHMPVMNGVELIRKIRATPALADLPVIVQTSDLTALGAPIWRDLHVSVRLDKADFLTWISRQIDEHVGITSAPRPRGSVPA
jgi:CheY-like chemotaxis protein